MEIRRTLMFACLTLTATSLIWAQKPANEPPKPDHSATSPSTPPPAAPSHASLPTTQAPGPTATPNHAPRTENPKPPDSGKTHLPNRPIVNPPVLPKEPKANPVGPDKIRRSKLERPSPKELQKPVPAANSAVLHARQAIAPVMPNVFWPSPMTIHQGQPLADALTGASAEVPGTFSYSPGPAYVPPQGECVVSISFLPVDTARYYSVSATVRVRVL
jgi:hypothetical protein